MSITQISVRPIRDEDVEQLDGFRKAFSDGRIDAPFGYTGNGIETAVAHKNGKTVGALLATGTVLFDFMKDPAASGTDIYGSVLLLERNLAYVAQKNGILAAYVAIPSHMTEWLDIVKRSGYTETFQDCVVLRRPLAHELTREK